MVQRTLILLCLLSFCGCSASPVARREIALLRSEIVDLENQYYALKSLYREATGREPDFSEVGFSNRSNWGESLGNTDVCDECGQIHDPQLEYDHPILIDAGESFDPHSGNSEPPPGSTPQETPDPEDITVPQVEPQPIDSSGFRRQPRSPATRVIEPATGQRAQRPLLDQSTNLTGIEIDATQTQGYDSDGLAGDDGILVVLIPAFDGNGETSPWGEVTISVVDPDQPREQQRLGLWKFSPYQVDSMVRREGDQSYLQVRLPWQNGPVRNDNLLVFARVRTPDGRSLERSASFPVRSGSADHQSQPEEIDLNEVSDPPITSGSSRNSSAWRPTR